MFCKVLLNVNIRQHGSHFIFVGEVNIIPDISVTFLPFAYNLITLQPSVYHKMCTYLVTVLSYLLKTVMRQYMIKYTPCLFSSHCQISGTVILATHLVKQ